MRAVQGVWIGFANSCGYCSCVRFRGRVVVSAVDPEYVAELSVALTQILAIPMKPNRPILHHLPIPSFWPATGAHIAGNQQHQYSCFSGPLDDPVGMGEIFFIRGG